MKSYRFESLIKKYTVSFTIDYPKTTTKPKDPLLYDNLGNYIGTDIPPQSPVMKGALLPAGERQIYNSGGRLTASDRLLYTLNHDIPKGSKITYDNKVYEVQPRTSYEDFADFSVYECKAVSS